MILTNQESNVKKNPAEYGSFIADNTIYLVLNRIKKKKKSRQTEASWVDGTKSCRSARNPERKG